MTRHSSSSQKEAEEHDANPGFWPLCSTARPPLPALFCGGNARARPGGGPGSRHSPAHPRRSPGPRAASAPSPAPAAAGRRGLRRAGPAPGRCERRSAPAGRGRTAPTRGAAAVAVAAGEVTSRRCAEPPPPGWDKRVYPRSALRSEVRQPPAPPPVLPAPPPAHPRSGAAAGPRRGDSPCPLAAGRAARGRGGCAAAAGLRLARAPGGSRGSGAAGPGGAWRPRRPAAPPCAGNCRRCPSRRTWTRGFPAATAKGAGRRPEPRSRSGARCPRCSPPLRFPGEAAAAWDGARGGGRCCRAVASGSAVIYGFVNSAFGTACERGERRAGVITLCYFWKGEGPVGPWSPQRLPPNPPSPLHARPLHPCAGGSLEAAGNSAGQVRGEDTTRDCHP